MGKHRQPVIADESHESAKKNLTRQTQEQVKGKRPAGSSGGSFPITRVSSGVVGTGIRPGRDYAGALLIGCVPAAYPGSTGRFDSAICRMT